MSAEFIGMSFEIATINAASEENGRIVAAKNAVTNKAISVMKYSQQLKLLTYL